LDAPPTPRPAGDLRRFQIEPQEDGVPVQTMNSVVPALRFFFATLDCLGLVRGLVRLAHPCNLPMVLSHDEVAGSSSHVSQAPSGTFDPLSSDHTEISDARILSPAISSTLANHAAWQSA